MRNILRLVDSAHRVGQPADRFFLTAAGRAVRDARNLLNAGFLHAFDLHAIGTRYAIQPVGYSIPTANSKSPKSPAKISPVPLI